MEKNFGKIGIIFNPEIVGAQNLALKLNNSLKNSTIFSIDDLNKNIDLAIIVGGDGTFLKGARYYSDFSIPILGFNMGRLGYLTQAHPDELEMALFCLKNNDFAIDERLMLKSCINGVCNIALNDVVVKGDAIARTSTYNLYINNKLLCSYVADGLIVSTPTGSTAYSLSAGGPIIAPSVECMIIIPICPHTLTTRPIVVPAFENIKIETKDKNQNLNISFDGQVDIKTTNFVEITKNDNYAKLLMLNKQKDKFYDILKEKLHWAVPLGK